MSQYEQENDFGRGGGEVDDETMKQAWEDADERVLGSPANEPEPGQDRPDAA